MLGKLGILITILALVLAFYFVISLGAGRFSKGETKPETKRYLRSVNILLIIIAVFGSVLVLFIVWLVFFTIMFAYNDTVIEFCKSLIA